MEAIILAKQHAIVTGGAGFIGSHLVERLLRDSYTVVAYDNFDNFYKGKEANLSGFSSNSNFQLVRGDILEYEKLLSTFQASEAELVFHLAGQPGVGFSLENPSKTNTVNTQGTLNVLKAALQCKINRVIYASSSSVYGAPLTTPISETHPTHPLSVYGASKLAAEHYCLIYYKLKALPVVCLRYHTVYGPRNRPDMAIYKWSRAMLTGQSVTIYGDGSQMRDFTYVDDIVEGTMLAVHSETAIGEVINLAAGETLNLKQVLSELENSLGQKVKISYEALKPWDPPTTHADITKARRLLNYTPRTRFEQGLRRFADWMLREHGNQPNS